MKKLILSFGLISVLFSLFFTLKAFAITAGTIPSNTDLGITQASPISDVNGGIAVLAGAVRIVYTVFFIVAVLMVIWAAYKFLFSNGDPKATETARKMITYAAVAIAVALLAVGLQFIVKDFLENPTSAGSSNSQPAPYPQNPNPPAP